MTIRASAPAGFSHRKNRAPQNAPAFPVQWMLTRPGATPKDTAPLVAHFDEWEPRNSNPCAFGSTGSWPAEAQCARSQAADAIVRSAHLSKSAKRGAASGCGDPCKRPKPMCGPAPYLDWRGSFGSQTLVFRSPIHVWQSSISLYPPVVMWKSTLSP